MSCRPIDDMVTERTDQILTQYRESPNLIALIKNGLKAAVTVSQEICDLPTKFYIDDAVGDQLTILGRRLGWGREHPICATQPVHGFTWEGVLSDYNLTGFGVDDAVWLKDGPSGQGVLRINSDDIYRQFLKVRRYQYMKQFDVVSLIECLKIFFGDAASVIATGEKYVVIAPCRELTDTENTLLQLYVRVLPIAPGVKVYYHFDSCFVAGFGEGYGGFLNVVNTGLTMTDESDVTLTDESSDSIVTDDVVTSAPWVCKIDVKPYTC